MDDVVVFDPAAARRTPQRRHVTGATRVCAVVGAPVAHSLSPVLHNAAFEAVGLDWTYVALPIESGDAEATLRAAWRLGLNGLSVTMPFKRDAAAAAATASPLVAETGAANTLVRTPGGWHAENTDVGGLVAFCTRDLGLHLAGAKVGIVGAGGAAAAAVIAMRDSGANVRVWNRTPERAEAVAALAGASGAATSDLSTLTTCDVLIGCVPAAALGPDVLAAAGFRSGQTVVDLAYSPPHTPLMEVASDAGADVHNGIGLLVNQAALQFELWTGRPAPLEVMSAAALADVAPGV